MKRIFFLLLLALSPSSFAGFSLGSSGSGGGVDSSDPAFTGTIDLGGGLFQIKDASDRTQLLGNTIEFNNAANTRSGLYINIDNSHPQLTTQGMDFWMEPGTNSAHAGGIACYPGQSCDLGYSVYQQGELPGFHQLRHMAYSGTLFFVPPTEATANTISSNASLMQLQRGGTIAGSSQGLQLLNASYWKIGNQGGGRYIENYLGNSSLYFTQQNIDFELNYESGHGKLIIADENAASDGKRLQTITLSSGTKIKANDSVTAKTIPAVIGISSPSNPGIYDFTVDPGVGYTINSSNPIDASTVKVLLIENGR